MSASTSEHFEAIEEQLKLFEDARGRALLQASSGDQARTSMPRRLWKSIVMGNFECDTGKAKLKEIIEDRTADVQEYFCPGKFTGSIGIIIFKENSLMWKFLKDHEGKEFKHEGKDLWHAI